jgi:hypothetical protein
MKQMAKNITSYTLLTAALVCAMMLTGCRAKDSIDQLPSSKFFFGPKANPRLVDEYRQFKYPGPPRGDDLDIIVNKRDHNIIFTNRTATTFKNVRLWLNQQYVTVLDTFPVGQTLSIPVANFINKHGEPYPAGGLLTPDRGYALVLAELYDPEGTPKVDPLELKPSKKDGCQAEEAATTTDAAPPKAKGLLHHLLVRTLDD